MCINQTIYFIMFNILYVNDQLQTFLFVLNNCIHLKKNITYFIHTWSH